MPQPVVGDVEVLDLDHYRRGEWTSAVEYAGGKISYTRIPRAEDFW